MLNPEEAREALKGFRAENVAAWRVDVVARMPLASREVGRVLLGLEQGMPGVPAGDWPTGVSRMAAHLDGLSLTERRRFFEALFPRMVPFLDLAWEMGAR